LCYPCKQPYAAKLAPNVWKVGFYGLPSVNPQYRFLIDFFSAYRFIRRIAPDVIEVGDPWLTPWLAIFGRKARLLHGHLVHFFHTDPILSNLAPWVEEKNGFFRRIVTAVAARLFYWLQKQFPQIVVTSPFMEQNLQTHNVTDVNIVPFGYDPLFRAKRFVRREPSSKFLYIGRLEPEKGVCLLIEALPYLLKIDGFQLTVVGDGQYRDFFASHKSPKLKFMGYIADRSRLLRVFNAHTYLIAPGGYETFHISALEAMTNGLIVIGASRGGTNDLVTRYRTPFVFSPCDAAGLVAAVKGALAADVAQLSTESIQISETFKCWTDAIEQLMHLYMQKTVRTV
jgi:alpha-1,6-mannosyltransferase